MKQPTFNWETEDKYSELKTFRLEVNNILSTYNTPQAEKLVMVKNWLGRKGLQLFEMVTNEEKTTFSTLEGIFETPPSKFKKQFKETRKSLEFWKLCIKDGENTEEWLQLTAEECNYQEPDRKLKDPFIHQLNDKEMLGEIIKELTTTKRNNTIASENIFYHGQRG